MRNAPSLKAVVRTDFIALIGALTPLIGIGIALAGAAGVLPDRSRSLVEGRLEMIPATGASFTLALAAEFVVLGVALLVWRVTKIRAAFFSGARVPGVITGLRPFKDRAYVLYEYEVHGRHHRARHFVHQSPGYRGLVEGKVVTIAVDVHRPQRAFVVELFEG